ncbi:probable E3 ubiquitin-protein ligase HECTD2 isoform X3 [Onychostruthus taczanowskii]|uniref:probable E3 ubiquitin-protein ligase HECTD2 isoform X3 n=1 Tax=Onychostruthus taczanowskii TaxID=356909 RepID=UPI001B80422F|nr:probable E3 ubiquitin-protein ligase HECTD2 isoform X3 [Onychostruthus taczanowskii]
MSLQSPPAAAELPPGPGEGHPPGAELSQGSAAAPSAEEGGEEEEEEGEGEKEKEKEKEKEGEKLPPIPSASTAAAGGLEEGAKNQFSTFSNFITTINQKKEDIGNRNSPTQLVIPNIKNGKDLPPLCLDVRQKQRMSMDMLPQEPKAPIPPEPSLPIRTKTVKDFQISQKRFKQVVERLLQFISLRLFPAKPEEFPPMVKCTWWIPSATKVLALFNAANSLISPPIISYTDFYNSTLDHIDLMEEYHNWQCYGNSHRFSFCQYPFIISIAAKKVIIQRDSEQQMISIARQSLVDKVSRRQKPDMNMLFLNVKVRRTHLVSDSLDELARKKADLKKKLKVTFVGEAGLDMGGLTKEWFLLLIRQIFHPDYGMFTYHKDSQCHWFSSFKCDNYSEFRLVGALMGLAVYNSITLDIRFPPCCYKKLLSPPIVPCDHNTLVGICGVTLDDLFQIMPELAHGLSELLSYEGNVEEDFYSTFQVFQEEFGVIKSYNLKPNGDKIPVTNRNRKEYVQLYVDFLLNRSIYKQFAAFYYGFHSVCASYALLLLRPEEVEILVCGSPELDMSALQRSTQYEGYQKTDLTIRYFWDVVLGFSLDLQKKLLHFATGSDRVPVGGMADLNFKISRSETSTNWLPVAHTCFNQLCLPPYKNKKELKQKLIIGISNAEGFGLE